MKKKKKCTKKKRKKKGKKEKKRNILKKKVLFKKIHDYSRKSRGMRIKICKFCYGDTGVSVKLGDLRVSAPAVSGDTAATATAGPASALLRACVGYANRFCVTRYVF